MRVSCPAACGRTRSRVGTNQMTLATPTNPTTTITIRNHPGPTNHAENPTAVPIITLAITFARSGIPRPARKSLTCCPTPGRLSTQASDRGLDRAKQPAARTSGTKEGIPGSTTPNSPTPVSTDPATSHGQRATPVRRRSSCRRRDGSASPFTTRTAAGPRIPRR